MEKSTTNSNIILHRPQSPNSRVEDELKKKSARALDSTSDPLEKLRLLCLSRGASGIMNLGRILRNMDVKGSKQLRKEEFFKAIEETGLDLSDKDAEELFDELNTENAASINIDEFMKQVRPPMSESRRAIVEQAFRKLDKSGEGVLSVADVRRVYSATVNPRYMSGEESSDVVIDRFLANFETEGVADGKITLEEFMNYYSGISISIEGDCYFDLLMRQAYRL